MEFYKLSVDDVLSRLKTSRLGLGEDKAGVRQGEFSLNELETRSAKAVPMIERNSSLISSASNWLSVPTSSLSRARGSVALSA